jgi:hypothetical protein
MQLDPDDPKVRDAAFGRQVEYFLESDVGRYLVKRARDESETAVEELKDVNPFVHPENIVEIQFRAKLADFIIVWLGDAIAAGEGATEQLKIEQAEG